MIPHRNTLRFITGLLLIGLLAPMGFAGPVEKGEKALEAKRYEDAAEAFKEALAANPKDARAAIGLGKAVRLGEINAWLRDAGDALESIREGEPGNLPVLAELGEVYMTLATRAASGNEAKLAYGDAEAVFADGAKRGPKDEANNVGLARSRYMAGNSAGALEALDAYLAQKPEQVAKASVWKGEVMYLDAMDQWTAARGDAGAVDAARKRFKQAMGAYAASAAADGTDYDTAYKLGVSAHYAGDRTTAIEAYKQAIALDGKAEGPVKFLNALLGSAVDREAYRKILTELSEKHPDAEYVLLYAAFDLYNAKEFAEADKLFKRLTKAATNPAVAWFYRGQIAREGGDRSGALKAFAKALEANSTYEDAAASYDDLLRDGRGPRQIIGSATQQSAKALIAEYEKLFKLAPKNVWARNNIAFILRDLFDAKTGRRGGTPWDFVLKESTRFYQEATDVIGDWDERYRTSMTAKRRYDYAGVVSDTALMYQFYESTRDYDHAIMLYDRALEWSDYGYFDAWNNLRQIYTKLESWQELYDLAAMCADGLVNDNLQPREEARAQARAVMKQLVESGKVEG